MSIRLTVLFMDLVLMFIMASNTPTFFNFALIVAFAIKTKLSTVVHWHPDLRTAPSKYINALIRSTLAPPGGKCPICLEPFYMPHTISCNHVFCRDCALLTFAKRDTCPVCLYVPQQLREVETAVPLDHLVESWLTWITRWVWTSQAWSVGWVVSCLCQLRTPARSEIMLAAMRTTIELALLPMVSDVLHSTTRIRLQPDRKDAQAVTISAACTLAVTMSYNYGAIVCFALLAVSIGAQIFEVDS